MKNTFLFFILVLMSFSCKVQRNEVNIEEVPVSTDSIEYARGFTIHSTDSVTIVNVINPWQGAENVCYRYSLIPRSIFGNDTDLSHIPVPVERVVCMSSSYVAFFNVLNAADVITGISGVGYVFDSVVRSRIDAGLIKEVGYDQTLNYELIASLKPDVLLCYGVGEESMSSLNKLKDLGIRVMVIGEYLENHPLGKTEWLKVFGSLVDKRQMSDSIFIDVQKNYMEVSRNARAYSGKIKPKVFLNLPYRDVWYAPGNDNYFVQFIRDAGGEYLFPHLTGSKSYPISFEKAYQAGLMADIWLCPGMANLLSDIGGYDERLTRLRPFVKGRVYNNNRRSAEKGGSDFWESGTVNPNVVLKDLVNIFYPDSLSDYELHYFKKLK